MAQKDENIIELIIERRRRDAQRGLTPAYDEGLTAFDFVDLLEQTLGRVQDEVENGDGEATLQSLLDLAATAVRFIDWTIVPEPAEGSVVAFRK
jgi:hypothetical protein